MTGPAPVYLVADIVDPKLLIQENEQRFIRHQNVIRNNAAWSLSAREDLAASAFQELVHRSIHKYLHIKQERIDLN